MEPPIRLEHNISQRILELARSVSNSPQENIAPSIIEKALSKEADLTARINEILSQAASTPEEQWLQLRDITYYLSFAESHLSKAEARPLHEVITKIKQIIHNKSDSIQPPWEGLIEAIDKEISKEKADRKTKAPDSHLKTHAAKPITAKTFAHIHAEQYISDTGLEGTSPSKILEQVLLYLNSYSKPSPELIELKEQLIDLLALYQEFHLDKQLKPEQLAEISQKFREKITEKISKLIPGKGFLIPTGWIGDPAGHAMYLQIKKLPEYFQGVIYNSGSGLEKYHPLLRDAGQLRVQPFVENNQISEQELGSSSFLKAQLELQCALTDARGRGTEFDKDDPYTLFKALEGSEAPCSDQSHHYIHPKGVGVCSWGALLAIFLHELKKEDYRAIHYDIRLNSICDFFSQIQDPAHANEQNEMLLQKAAEQFARDSLIDYREGTISLAELERVQATLKELFSFLEHIRKSQIYASENKRALDLKGIDQLPIREGIVMEIPNAFEIESSKKSNKSAVAVPLTMTDLSGLNDPAKINETLTTFRIAIKTIAASYDFFLLDKSMATFFENLPLPNKVEFWNSIPNDQVIPCMQEIAEICSIGRMGHDNPTLAIGTLKAFAINFSLYHRAVAADKWSYPSGNLPLDAILSEILSTEHGGRPKVNRNCDNPQLRRELASIVSFLQSKQGQYNPDLFPCRSVESRKIFTYEFPYNGRDEEPKWIETQADKPDIRMKMETEDPAMASKPKFHRCVKLAKDFEGKYLHPGFCALKKNTFILLSLLYSSGQYNTFYPALQEYGSSATISFINNDINDKRYSNNKVRPPPYGITSLYTDDHFLNHMITASRKNHYPGNQVYLTESHIKFMEKYFPDLARRKDIPIELMKELCTLMTSGDYDGDNPHLELQPSKILAYFTDNLHLLSQKQYQDFFTLLFFEGNFLEILLEKNPSYIHTIETFMNKGLQFFAEKGDFFAQAFILEQAQFVRRIAQGNYPFKAADPIEQINKWLSRSDLTEEERVFLSIKLVNHYAQRTTDELSTEDFLHLITACFLVTQKWGSINLNKYFSSKADVQEILNQAFRIHWEGIEKMVLSAAGSDLLNRLCVHLTVKPPNEPWDFSLFPLCTAQNIRINFKSQQITSDESKYVYLPLELTQYPQFSQTFKKDSYLGTSLGSLTYEFIDEYNRKARVRLNRMSKTVDIQYELEPNRYYTLLSNVPDEIKKAGGSQSLAEGQTLWQSLSQDDKVEFVYLDNQKNPVTRLTLKRNAEKADIMKEFNAFRADLDFRLFDNDQAARYAYYLLLLKVPPIKDLSYLNAVALNKREPLSVDHPEVRQFLNEPHSHPKLEQLAALVIKLSEKPMGILEKVEKILPNGTKLQLVDIYQENTPFTMFETFTGKNEINLWKNENGELALLEIPRFGLSFEMKKVNQTWQAFSKDYPNFKLSANQKVKGLLGFHGGLVIENSRGERRLLLPRMRMIPKTTGALTRNFAYNVETKRNCLMYPIHSKEGIVADTREKQLLMAQLHLARKDYTKAHQFLLKSYSKAVGYSEEEKEILYWVFETSKTLKDGDPRSKAIALQTLILLLKDNPNYLKERLKNHEFWLILDDALSAYRDPTQWTDLKWNQEDNNLFIDALFENLPKDFSLNNLWLLEAAKSESREIDPAREIYARSAIPEKAFIKIEIPNSSTFTQWCSVLSRQAYEATDEYPLITRSRGHFTEAVLNGNLYEMIKNRAPGAQVQLAFAQKDPSIDPFFVDLMMTIFEHPDQFPDRTVFERCIEYGDFSLFQRLFLTKYSSLKNSSLKPTASSTKIKDVKGKPTKSTSNTSIQTEFKINSPPSILTPKQLAGHFTEVPFVGIQLNAQEIQELQKTVEIKGSPLATKKTQELQEDINTAWKNPVSKRAFLPPERIDPLKTTLLVQKAEQTKSLNLDMQELLAAANQLPADPAARAQLGLERQATLRQEITFHDLCICLINRNTQALLEKNPHLAAAEISRLLNSTLQVLQRAKQVQKIQRSLNNLAEMEDFKNKPDLAKNIDYLDLSQKLRENLTAPPAYPIEEKPEYSLFEYLANIQLYPGQVRDLDTLIGAEGKNADLIMQKIMGSGKSKVFLPILALKKADGVRLPMIVVPSALYQTTLRDMDATSGSIFGQTTNTLAFSRSSDFSLQALKNIRLDMERMITRKEYVVITDVSLHTLHDQFKEMLINYLNRNHKLPLDKRNPPSPELIEIRKILSLLKVGIFDEADQLLHQRFEVNFTSGKPEPISTKHTEVVRDIFECIFTTPALLEKIIPAKRTSEDNKHVEEASFTQARWDAEIKPLLVNEFLKFELKRATALGNFLRQLSESDQALIVDYWMNGDEGDQFVARMQDSSIQNLLAIAKGEFHELLPFTLNRPISYKYGRSLNPHEVLAVPYVGNTKPNPSPNAQFGNPYELLNYCSQLYLIEGVSQPVLRAIVERIKARVMQEMAKDSSLRAQETNAYQEFVDLCAGNRSVNLMRMSDQDFANLEKRYKEDKSLVFDFLSRYIYPRVEIYAGKIVSNHLDLVDLFSESVVGFSGTPYNKEMYHSRLRTQMEPGTDGKTLGILKKNSSSRIHAISKNSYTAILDELLKNVGPASPVRTFQDTAALFNGIPNEQIAQEILKRIPHLRGVRYYDTNNQMQVMERRGEVFISVPLEKTQTTHEDSFTYFSQLDTTGKDTLQIDQAIGFTTIGKTLTSRDLFQGVWRLRKLDKNQIAELVHIPEVADFIRQELRLDPHAVIDFDQIAKFTRLIEIRELENQLPGNVMQKMTHVIENRVEKMALDPQVDLLQLVDAAPVIERLFKHGQADEPYKLFGRKERLANTAGQDGLIETKIQEGGAVVDELKKASPLFSGWDSETIKKQMHDTVDWSILPKQMISPVRTNRDMTVEVQRELEQEQEVNIQRLKELQQETEIYDPNQDAYYHWNWSDSPADKDITLLENYLTTPPTILQNSMSSFPSAKRIPHMARTESKGNPPISHMKDIMRFTKVPGEDIFDFMASYNFLPMASCYMLGKGKTQHAVPFDKRQIDVNHYLILRHHNGALEMVLISNAEAGYFYSRLPREQGKGFKDPLKSCDVFLGHISLGLIQGTKPELVKEIEGDYEFMRLTTQAKFFKGELNYTKKEQEYLRGWIQRRGIDRMEEFFYKEVLRHKPDQREAYPRSILGKLFKEVRQASLV